MISCYYQNRMRSFDLKRFNSLLETIYFNSIILLFFSRTQRYYNNKISMSSLSPSESVLVKELFVSSKTPVQCHLTRAVKHLELDNSVLILNGLGKAIKPTIDVALKLQQKFHNTIKLDIQTSTADIKDILEPLNDEDDFEARTRSLSSIHIKITK